MALLKIQTRKKLLPLSIAVALGTFATNAYASSVTIDTSGSYTIGTGADIVSGSTSNSLDSAIDTATAVSSFGNGSTVDYTSDAYYATSGDTNGAFYARAYGDGAAYDVTSSITYVDTIFNTSGIAQNYTFDFNITQGALSVYGIPTATGDYAYADYSVDIFLTNSSGVTTSIFSSAAQLNMNDAGVTTFTGDTTLGGAYDNSGYYGWTNYTGTIDLGTFNANDSFTLTYGMTATARGQMTPDPTGGGAIGYGECGIECGEGGGVTGGSRSRTGDPFGISGTGTTISSTPVSVPEASSIFLMGLGLAGLAATRRRRSKLNG